MASIAVRGCSASLSAARSVRRPVSVARVPARSMFGGLFGGGNKDKKEVRRAGVLLASGGGRTATEGSGGAASGVPSEGVPASW